MRINAKRKDLWKRWNSDSFNGSVEGKYIQINEAFKCNSAPPNLVTHTHSHAHIHTHSLLGMLTHH